MCASQLCTSVMQLINNYNNRYYNKLKSIAQNFDEGNIDRFDAQLVMSKFSLSIFSNCIANTGCLRDYPSIFSLSNF